MKEHRHRHRRISILGSTGSIGKSALDVARHLGGCVEIVGLSAGSKGKELFEQAKAFRPDVLGIWDEEQGAWLESKIRGLKGKRPKVFKGKKAMEQVAATPRADMVLTAVVGSQGLVPTLKAIETGKDIALANKETLVAGGELVSKAIQKSRVSILPVDSEHNAIFQCLTGIGGQHELKRLILTASGGPFRGASLKQLSKVTPAQALKHPTWTMGAKITVDSATLMNKGLEVIEAHWLFGVPFDRISVLVHPQSVVHSMVEAVDGNVLAQLGPTDMRLPIQFAFTYPERQAVQVKPLDFLKVGPLTFEEPDLKLFPCLGLAYEAGRLGGAAPAALNAANEVAVEAFLKGSLSFLGIPKTLARVVSEFRKKPKAEVSLQSILKADLWARERAGEIIYG